MFLMSHPEDICQRCKGANIIWSAPSPLWNEVMRSGDINGDWEFGELICPTCFGVLAKERGVATHFRLYATNVTRKLQNITPSGRIWNEKTWLFEEPKVDNRELQQ